jgi:hypothetical protein
MNDEATKRRSDLETTSLLRRFVVHFVCDAVADAIVNPHANYIRARFAKWMEL